MSDDEKVQEHLAEYHGEEKRSGPLDRRGCLFHGKYAQKIIHLEGGITELKDEAKEHHDEYIEQCKLVNELTVEQAQFRVLFRFASWIFGLLFMTLITISTAGFFYQLRFQEQHLEEHKREVAELDKRIERLVLERINKIKF